MKKSRLALIAVIAIAIAAFFLFDLGRFFTLEFFKSQQAAIAGYFNANPFETAAGAPAAVAITPRRAQFVRL